MMCSALNVYENSFLYVHVFLPDISGVVFHVHFYIQRFSLKIIRKHILVLLAS